MKRRLVFYLSVLVLGLAVCASAAPRRVTRARKPKPAATFKLEAVNDPATSKPLSENDRGAAALRAQILLDRAGFSVGEIDGRIGKNAVRALTGFETARGLPASETIDQPVWMALNSDSAPALIPYTLTAEDVKGPFVRVPKDMMAQARLAHLGYSSAFEKLGEKFHCSPALLRALNPVSRLTPGEHLIVPNVRSPLQAKAARIVVSKNASTVAVFDGFGKLIAQYPCTSGSEHDPLPLGEWKVTGIHRNPVFYYNPDLFWNSKPEDSKAKIAPGPNNPVGLVWIDLSKEHYGIHGTPSPSTIGHTESHGCVRLTNWDALELAGMVAKDLPVTFQE